MDGPACAPRDRALRENRNADSAGAARWFRTPAQLIRFTQVRCLAEPPVDDDGVPDRPAPLHGFRGQCFCLTETFAVAEAVAFAESTTFNVTLYVATTSIYVWLKVTLPVWLVRFCPLPSPQVMK